MRLLGSLVAVAVLAASLTAAENPQVAAIHNQIKALKAEEKVTLKTIHAWYESFIKRDKFTGAVLLQERKVLAKQEQELLAVAATPEAKNEIRAHYDALRALLREDSKIDAAVIRKLRQMEKTHETYVGNAYKSKIHFLEAQAKSLAAAGKAAKAKKK